MLDLTNLPTDQLKTVYDKACTVKAQARELFGITEASSDLLSAAADLVEAAEVELNRRGELQPMLEAAFAAHEAQRATKQGGMS